MKAVLGQFLLSREFQASAGGAALRALIRKSSGVYNYSLDFLVDSQTTERPHYAYCMANAAKLAQRTGIKRISALEFGVAGGNGLSFMVDFARRIEQRTGVSIACYGFDTGEGMPEPEGPEDLHYWFRAAQYPMDEAALRRKLPEAELVLGNVRETVPAFVEKFRPPPIAIILNDVDYYSSTRDNLALFDNAAAQAEHFLPQIFMYMDDIIGSAAEMYGPFNGPLLAINEYNQNNPDVKIHLNQNLLPLHHVAYRHQIYYVHLFKHPQYSTFLGDAQQGDIHEALKLR